MLIMAGWPSVRAGTSPEPHQQRLHGVVLPGLANGHSHAFHRALRGRTHRDGGTFWTWREQMYAVAARLDPDSYAELARAVFAEMALAGYTCVGEFHYLHHDQHGRAYADPNAMGAAVIAAAADVGIRLTLLDTCYLAGGLDDHGHRPVDRIQQRFSDGTAEAWAERVRGPPSRAGTGDRSGGALGSRGSGDRPQRPRHGSGGASGAHSPE